MASAVGGEPRFPKPQPLLCGKRPQRCRLRSAARAPAAAAGPGAAPAEPRPLPAPLPPRRSFHPSRPWCRQPTGSAARPCAAAEPSGAADAPRRHCSAIATTPVATRVSERSDPAQSPRGPLFPAAQGVSRLTPTAVRARASPALPGFPHPPHGTRRARGELAPVQPAGTASRTGGTGAGAAQAPTPVARSGRGG
ncbi:PREDICTED: predicted GPI-anchored protein 58 [Lepidothrix coronata]|uniref:Predicted GPI-anchored protein 58 n=1 Tax=Lepidothrix coronata TaxID=321398 RepID=A0A6J0GK72_9PASS|nr:PREDICTED: predicted GPI-anchored protein 58 [Lepidothrix coronata]